MTNKPAPVEQVDIDAADRANLIWCDAAGGPSAAVIAACLARQPLAARVAELEAENARFKEDRLYIVGFNDGWDEAVKQGVAALRERR